MNRLSNVLSGKLPFFYGYVVLLVAFVAQVCSSPGQTYAIAAFTPKLQENLGLSNSQLSTAYMLGTLLAAIPLVFVGRLADRYGLRLTTTVVAVAMGGACFVASHASGFYTLLLAFFLLRFLGQGSLTLLSGNLLSMWFRKSLGRINATMWAGGAIAFALIPPAMLRLIAYFDWRTTYAILGTIILCVLPPMIVLLFRNRPEDVGQELDGIVPLQRNRSAESSFELEPEICLREAVRHRAFWILAAGMCLWAMIGTGIVFYALPIFASYGIESGQSQLLFTTLSASMLVTQIVGGIQADRRPMHHLLAIGFALLAAGTAVVPLTTSLLHVHLFALLFGAGQGLAISVNATMWPRYYGRKYLGEIRGTVWCLTVAGSGCGPLLLGIISDATGSFSAGLWCYAAALIPMAPLSLIATAPPLYSKSPPVHAEAA